MSACSRRIKSGKAGTKRPAFDEALAFLRPEDVLVVWKLDRLGRSLVEMMRTIDGLRVKEVHFRSLTEQFDSATAHGRFALQMHGAMAEYFLDLKRERTMEGLKAALARGRKGGRPKKLKEADLEAAGRCWRPARSVSPRSPSGSASIATPSTATSPAPTPTRARTRREPMPIRREHRFFYPIDWPQLSALIGSSGQEGAARAAGGRMGAWSITSAMAAGGMLTPVGGAMGKDAGSGSCQESTILGHARRTRVVLAAAHRDHDPRTTPVPTSRPSASAAI